MGKQISTGVVIVVVVLLVAVLAFFYGRELMPKGRVRLTPEQAQKMRDAMSRPHGGPVSPGAPLPGSGTAPGGR